MPRSFHDRVTADGLTAGPFLATFGQTVTRYPKARERDPLDVTNPEDVLAVVVLDDETKVSQEGIGQPTIRHPSRENIPRTGILEVTELQETHEKDAWSLPNFGPDYETLIWKTTRIEGRDCGMKAIYVERAEDKSTSRFTRR